MRRLRDDKIDTPEYYEKIWGVGTNKHPFYDAVRQRALIKYVGRSSRVLDVGAGVYGACQYIAEKTDLKPQLNCVDFSYTAKEIVDELKLPIDFRIGDIEEKIPYANGSFDAVIAGEIIEHMERPEKFAKELARVTVPKGMISLSTVDTKSRAAIKHGEYPEHIWEFTPEDLIELFEPFGKTTYEIVGNYHFIYCLRN